MSACDGDWTSLTDAGGSGYSGGSGGSTCPANVLGREITGVWSDGHSVLAARIDGSVFRFSLPSSEWKRELDPESNTYSGPGSITFGGRETFWAFEGTTSDLWAGGSVGAIAHFDGRHWSRTRRPVPWSIQTIWVNSPSDVWAAGSWDTLLRYQSGLWTVLATSWPSTTSTSSGEYRSIWGSDAKNIYAVYRGLQHFDGAVWTSVPVPRSPFAAGYGIDHVWGTTATDVYVVERHGRILHFDGNSWRILDRPDGSAYACSVGTNGAKAASGPFALCEVGGINRVMEFRGGAIVGENQSLGDGSGTTAFYANPSGTIVLGTYCGTVSVRPAGSYWRTLP